MTRNFNKFDRKICLLIVTVVLVPGVARAVNGENGDQAQARPQLQSAEGIKANERIAVSTPHVYKRPQLPAHVHPAERPVAMPRNEKIRIVPLDTLQLPAAVVLAQPLQPSLFKTTPTVQPAAAPVQALAVKPAVEQTKKS